MPWESQVFQQNGMPWMPPKEGTSGDDRADCASPEWRCQRRIAFEKQAVFYDVAGFHTPGFCFGTIHDRDSALKGKAILFFERSEQIQLAAAVRIVHALNFQQFELQCLAG